MEPPSLPHLVRAAMTRKGYTSMYQVEAASGGELVRSTLSRVLRGDAVRVSTIDALVKHLGLSRAAIVAALGHEAAEDIPERPFALPDHASLLTGKERRVVLGVVTALLAARGIDLDRR